MRYLYALLALEVLIALHEAAHAVAARLLGIGVRRFAIGFGPPLFSWRKGGVLLALCAVPLGAFAELAEAGPNSMAASTRWKRVMVILAGPLANLAAALGVLFALYLGGTHVAVPMTVGTIEPGSEAARAGLRPGDLILAADGEPIAGWSELTSRVSETPGVMLTLTVSRPDERLRIEVTPRADASGAGRLGVTQQYVFRQHPAGEAASRSLAHAGRLVTDGARHLARLARGGRSAWLPSAVPLFNQASDVAATGLDAFLRVAAGLSIALAALSLLPVPSLDGGRLLFLGVEALTGRRPGVRLETALHALGFLALAALGVALAVRAITAGR